MEPRRTVGRSLRLAQIQQALYKSPDGLTSKELAKLCGVCARTIQRDLLDLQTHLDTPLSQLGDRYGIVGNRGLPPVFFSLYEAIALFLACRLALRQSNANNPYMREALAKMSAAMPPELATRLILGINGNCEEADTNFAAVFEAVGLGWIEHRQVKLRYHYPPGHQVGQHREWILEPYFIEMSGAGRSTYVFGHAFSERLEGFISLRLDRITKAEVLPKSFRVPSEAELEALLRSAWGTMWQEDTEVRFRLPDHMASQVKASVARSTESEFDSPAEGYSVALHISSWLEAHPIMRGFPPTLQELTPELLEQYFIEHAKRFEESCGLLQSSDDSGKSEKQQLSKGN